ncbi:MAG: O-antigen ligase family protein [Kastovskya adunca ATA6-11-RM4]|jgi:O-antigen ligase|nr:O-antigen ligase family protein [Kastovskya adunca ATA6-11-RM4]
MKSFYTLLFALSLLLINPWGTSRGEIWTTPKVLVIVLIVIANFSLIWWSEWWEERKALTIPRSWYISLLLWGLFLSIGLLATLYSPFPLRSFLGQEQMGDGWLYWLIIAAFTLSNTLLLRIHPELLRPQLIGLLLGGVILAISIFPQLIDWRIDYTATTGQLLKENILASTIFRGQQPIGLYSHRGHASFVLAAVAVLGVVAWRWGWFSGKVMTAILIPIISALLLTQTRMGIVALLVALAYLLGRKYYKLLISAALVCLLVVGITTTTRQIAGLPAIKQVTSDRVYLWELSWRGISSRPLLGWGFDGFGTAYPYVLNPKRSLNVVSLGNFSFDYVGKDGRLYALPIPTVKAHNLILDATVSAGVLGMLTYLTLLGLCVWGVINSPFRGMEAVAVVYLVFTLTWFECAQFTHLAWWALSFWGVSKKVVG